MVLLIDFVKAKNKGYEPKKSAVFEVQDLDRFFLEAPDEKYLLMKVSNNNN